MCRTFGRGKRSGKGNTAGQLQQNNNLSRMYATNGQQYVNKKSYRCWSFVCQKVNTKHRSQMTSVCHSLSVSFLLFVHNLFFFYFSRLFCSTCRRYIRPNRTVAEFVRRAHSADSDSGQCDAIETIGRRGEQQHPDRWRRGRWSGRCQWWRWRWCENSIINQPGGNKSCRMRFNTSLTNFVELLFFCYSIFACAIPFSFLSIWCECHYCYYSIWHAVSHRRKRKKEFGNDLWIYCFTSSKTMEEWYSAHGSRRKRRRRRMRMTIFRTMKMTIHHFVPSHYFCLNAHSVYSFIQFVCGDRTHNPQTHQHRTLTHTHCERVQSTRNFIFVVRIHCTTRRRITPNRDERRKQDWRSKVPILSTRFSHLDLRYVWCGVAWRVSEHAMENQFERRPWNEEAALTITKRLAWAWWEECGNDGGADDAAAEQIRTRTLFSFIFENFNSN